MKLFARRKSEQNHAAVDPWTLVHFATGMAAGLMDLSFPRAIGVALGYELMEQYVERQSWGQELFQTSRPETGPNAVMDLVAYGAGYWAGTWWNRTADEEAAPAGQGS